jgi:hypothetical protein
METPWYHLSFEAWLTLFALIAGPFFAHYWHAWKAERSERTSRRRRVFSALMSTRASRVSPTHVDALNAIDIEFGEKDDKSVRDAWHVYLDHLNDTSFDSSNADAMSRWGEKGNDLFIDLLSKMSETLGYSFDKVALKHSVYYPKGHGESDTDQYLLRKFLVEVMAGKRPLWTGVMTGNQPLRMEIVNLPAAPPAPALQEEAGALQVGGEAGERT